jgi:hypothetical protein
MSPDDIRHFLKKCSPMDNAEIAPIFNTQSLFGSKPVTEKKPRSCLEFLKHLKPLKTKENKTKSPELMKRIFTC